MKFSLEKINTLRLSGIQTILGVDIFKNRIRVAELKPHGGIVNKFRSTYTAVDSFSFDFQEGLSVSERGRFLGGELKKKGVKTRFCVSTIRSMNSRTVIADIPIEASDGSSGDVIQSWIRENYEKLVRVPIPLDQLVFDYDIISADTSSVRCEISFVRVSERDEILELAKAAGLHLLTLGLGVRDSEIGFLVSGDDSRAGTRAFILADEDGFTCTMYPKRAGNDGESQVVRKKLQMKSVRDVIDSLTSQFGVLDRIVVTGPGAPQAEGGSTTVWNPLGLSPEFALPVGLAIHGFLSAGSNAKPVHALDFRTDKVKDISNEETDKVLFKTSVLVMGGMLLLLLAVQFGLQSYIGNSSDRLDRKLSQIGPIYSQVKVLERQVGALRMELNGQDALQESSDVSRVLHEIASATPKNVWLYRLTYSNQDRTVGSVHLWGYAETNGAAASYLADLQADTRFAGVQVIRVGAPTQLEAASFASGSMKSFVTFEAKLKVAS